MAARIRFRKEFEVSAEKHFHPKKFDQLNDLQRTHFMSVFFLQTLLQNEMVDLSDDSFTLMENNLIDGAHDQKADLIYCDESSDPKTHYIIQTKFSGTSSAKKNDDDDEILAFTQLLLKANNEDYKKTQSLQKAFDLMDFEEDIFKFYWITFNGIPEDAKAIKEISIPNIYDFSDRSEINIYAETDLNILMRSSKMDKSGGLDLDLQLYKDRDKPPWIVYENDEFKSYVGLLTIGQVDQILKKESFNTERLFNLNIRRNLNITKTSINGAMTESASKDSENFFFYNNGISAMAKEINDDSIRGILKCKDFSIINGAQTFISLSKAYQTGKINNEDVKVMIRVTENPHLNSTKHAEFNDKITQFNNTQNKVNPSDFRSNDGAQLSLVKLYQELPHHEGKKQVYQNKRGGGVRATKTSIPVKLEDFCHYIFSFKVGPIDVFGGRSYIYSTEKKGGYERLFDRDEFGQWERLSTETFKKYSAIYNLGVYANKKLNEIRSQKNWEKLFNEKRGNSAININQLIFCIKIFLEKLYPDDDVYELLIKLKLNEFKTLEENKGLGIFFDEIIENSVKNYREKYNYEKETMAEEFAHRNYLRNKKLITNIRDGFSTFNDPNYREFFRERFSVNFP